MKFWPEQTVLADPVALDTRGKCAKSKAELPSKLEERKDDDKADKSNLATWRKDVNQRDGGKSRYSGIRLERTIRVQANRAEAHHIKPRSFKATRWLRKNGILLSLVEHEAVEKGALMIVGTQFFEVDGQHFIDGDAKVFFLKWRERDHRTHGWVFDRVG